MGDLGDRGNGRSMDGLLGVDVCSLCIGTSANELWTSCTCEVDEASPWTAKEGNERPWNPQEGA